MSAPEVGKPAGEGGDRELPDHQSGSRDGRVGPAPSRESTEQQKSTPCAETGVVTQGEPGQVPPRQQHAHGTTRGSFSEHSGQVEEIYLPEDGPAELGAYTSIADAEWAGQEARKADFQSGLVLWAYGSRDENGAVGYAVAWRKGRSWAGRKTHMGFYQAYGAECAAIARALEVAAERAKRRRLGRVLIFTDAQAAITRMTHNEPGPGQTCALQVRKAIAALREREAAIEIEIRWCPAHKGIPGNEIADGWAKQAASEPDDHGVEWLKHADKYGRCQPQRPT